MLHEKIEIKIDGDNGQAYAYTYIQDYSDDLSIRKRPIVILCPGGGYAYTSDREAEPMAMSFIWATFEDGSVPVQNSMMFAEALVEAGVSTELHIFPHGGHGYALADERTTSRALKEKDSQAAKWTNLVNNWILREFPMSHCTE